jgi:hypothetical protein
MRRSGVHPRTAPIATIAFGCLGVNGDASAIRFG